MRKLAVAVLALSISGNALAAEAAALYASKCNACHGKDGKGTPVGLKMGAPDLTTLKASEAEVTAAITNGKGKMTGFKGKISDDEIKALAKYVKGGLK
jgi:cytochrome c6